MKMMELAGFRSCRSSSATSQPASLSTQQIAVLKAVLTAGLYDSVGRMLFTPSVDVLERVVCMAETPQGRAQVHPSSVNRNLQTHGWLLYQEKVRRKHLWGWFPSRWCWYIVLCRWNIQKSTCETPLWYRLSPCCCLEATSMSSTERDSSHLMDGSTSRSEVTGVHLALLIDSHWFIVVFKAPVRIGVIFKHLRKLMDSLLEKKLENPKMNVEGDGWYHWFRFITVFRGIFAKELTCFSQQIKSDSS